MTCMKASFTTSYGDLKTKHQDYAKHIREDAETPSHLRAVAKRDETQTDAARSLCN